MALNEIHRVLLTYVRSVKSISLENLLDAFQFMCSRLAPPEEDDPVAGNRESLEEYIRKINAEITKQGFKIDRKNDELNGTLYFIFINTVIDDVTKQNTSYSIAELVAIKKIIENIVEAHDYGFQVRRVVAQQVASAQMNRTLNEASSFIDKLIDDGWFDATLDEKLVLSINTLCELKQYLIDGYGVYGVDDGGKLLSCVQCKELVTLGLRSRYRQAFHRKCYEVHCRNNGMQMNEANMIRVGADPENL
ncbi:uncharacterized protein LODBEIA_P54270 [Lodderomyces beijingensis]|uniref:Non-structural maintenance of chromosomes element 1 homolog n=1 Tax=Lodderomyces beijingensis TaxID=1775926 RepID=A0ABP0ZSU0_9ASCO